MPVAAVNLNSPVNTVASGNNTLNSSNRTFKPNAFKPTPLAVGVMSTAFWTGVGMLFDKGLSKIMKSAYNIKNSVKINLIFGFVMGIIDYFKARKRQKT